MASFNGSEFRGLDDQALAEDQPLDSFVERTLTSGLTWLDAHPDAVSWSPRGYDTASDFTTQRHRPYASVARSTILYVPWIVQPGLVSLSVLYALRTGYRSDSGGSVTLTSELVGLSDPRRRGRKIATIPTAHPWSTAQALVKPLRAVSSERVVPLALAIGSEISLTVIASATSAPADWRRGGSLYVPTNSILPAQPAIAPAPDDLHVQALYQSELGVGHDVLYARTVPNEAAYLRPGEEYGAWGVSRREITFAQVRSVQIAATYSQVRVVPDRYLPQRTVEAADAIQHAYQLQRLAQRKRCIAVGPTGQLGDPERWQEGYGPRFERVEGSHDYQPWATTQVELREIAGSKIKILAYVIATYSKSGWEQLDGAEGVTQWDVRADIVEVGKDTIEASASVEALRLRTYPVGLLRGESPFLLQERLLEGLEPRAPFKEGQLFDEDRSLCELIELDLPEITTVSTARPLVLRLSARTDFAERDLPASPTGTIGTTVKDCRLVLVGYTVWEVPRG